MEIGDKFTITGYHPCIANDDRKWWQLWKPRMIADTSRLSEFTIQQMVVSAYDYKPQIRIID